MRAASREFEDTMHGLRYGTRRHSGAEIGANYENLGAKFEDSTYGFGEERRRKYRSSASGGRDYVRSASEAAVAGCDETMRGKDGMDYRGCQETSVGGYPCQHWSSQYPNVHDYVPENYPEEDLSLNFCRNPNGKRTIWCFVKDKGKRWDYCHPVERRPESQVGGGRSRSRSRQRSTRRMSRGELEDEVDRLRGRDSGRNRRGGSRDSRDQRDKKPSYCPELTFPKMVMDCGKHLRERGNDRACKNQPEDCVGEKWFSKIDDPKGPSAINAVHICRNQGYEGADKLYYGGNFGIHCLFPGKDVKHPNKLGGSLENFGKQVSWRCRGHQKCIPRPKNLENSVANRQGRVHDRELPQVPGYIPWSPDAAPNIRVPVGYGSNPALQPGYTSASQDGSNPDRRDREMSVSNNANNFKQCPRLPVNVVDCGVDQENGERRECHDAPSGCVGAGWFSKKKGTRDHPKTVNAIRICKNRGYDGVDTTMYGGNYDTHCRYPGKNHHSNPNLNGGALNNLGISVVWKCTGEPNCGSHAAKSKESSGPNQSQEHGEEENKRQIGQLIGASNCQGKVISDLVHTDGSCIWSNGKRVFYQGDKGVVVANAPNLSGMNRLNIHPSNVIGDSQNGKLYRLCHDCDDKLDTNLLDKKTETYAPVNQLQCLNDNLEYTASVALPRTYYVRLPYFHAVGSGEIAFLDDHMKWHILTLTCKTTPTVKELGNNMGRFEYNTCDKVGKFSGYSNGILEKSGGVYRILYFSSETDVARKVIPRGDQEVFFTVPQHRDKECSLAVDYQRKMLFYHATSIGGEEEFVEYCDAHIKKPEQAVSKVMDISYPNSPMEFDSGSVQRNGKTVSTFGNQGQNGMVRSLVQKVEQRLHMNLNSGNPDELGVGRAIAEHRYDDPEVQLGGKTPATKNFLLKAVSNCAGKEMEKVVEDQSGLTWFDGKHVYYEGKKGVARMKPDLEDMKLFSETPLRNVVSDPSTGKMFRLCNNCGTNPTKQRDTSGDKTFQTVNELLCLNSELGGLKSIKLPQTFKVKFPYFHAVGNGEMAFLDDQEKWNILKLSCDEDTAAVTVLGKNEGELKFQECPNKYSSGVLEKVEGKYSILFFSGKGRVSKKAIPGGEAHNLLKLPDEHSSNECSFAVDYAGNKFFYHAAKTKGYKQPIYVCHATIDSSSANTSEKLNVAMNEVPKLKKEKEELKSKKKKALDTYEKLKKDGYGHGNAEEKAEFEKAQKAAAKYKAKYKTAKKEEKKEKKVLKKELKKEAKKEKKKLKQEKKDLDKKMKQEKKDKKAAKNAADKDNKKKEKKAEDKETMDKAEAAKDRKDAKKDAKKLQSIKNELKDVAKKDMEKAEKKEKKKEEKAEKKAEKKEKETEKKELKKEMKEEVKKVENKLPKLLKDSKDPKIPGNSDKAPSLPSNIDGAQFANKIDGFFTWLRSHFSSTADFKGDKDKIAKKMKAVRAKLVALAGKGDDKSKDERLDLQEEMMELQHEDRMRKMREHMMLKMLHERDRERVKRWQSKMIEYESKPGKRYKAKREKLREKIQAVNLQMKMRKIKLKAAEEEAKEEKRLMKQVARKEEKKQQREARKDAKKKAKKLEKKLKKGKKILKKEVKKLEKKGVKKDSKLVEKMEKKYKQFKKKVKKKEKKVLKVRETQFDATHYKKRLDESEKKRQKQHQLILYLQDLVHGKDPKAKGSKAGKDGKSRRKRGGEQHMLQSFGINEMDQKKRDKMAHKLLSKLNKRIYTLEKSVHKHDGHIKELQKLKKSRDEISVSFAAKSRYTGRCAGDAILMRDNILTADQCASQLSARATLNYASFNAVREECHLFEACDVGNLQRKDDFVTVSAMPESGVSEDDLEDSSEDEAESGDSDEADSGDSDEADSSDSDDSATASSEADAYSNDSQDAYDADVASDSQDSTSDSSSADSEDSSDTDSDESEDSTSEEDSDDVDSDDSEDSDDFDSDDSEDSLSEEASSDVDSDDFDSEDLESPSKVMGLRETSVSESDSDSSDDITFAALDSASNDVGLKDSASSESDSSDDITLRELTDSSDEDAFGASDSDDAKYTSQDLDVHIEGDSSDDSEEDAGQLEKMDVGDVITDYDELEFGDGVDYIEDLDSDLSSRRQLTNRLLRRSGDSV